MMKLINSTNLEKRRTPALLIARVMCSCGCLAGTKIENE